MVAKQGKPLLMAILSDCIHSLAVSILPCSLLAGCFGGSYKSVDDALNFHGLLWVRLILKHGCSPVGAGWWLGGG